MDVKNLPKYEHYKTIADLDYTAYFFRNGNKFRFEIWDNAFNDLMADYCLDINGEKEAMRIYNRRIERLRKQDNE